MDKPESKEHYKRALMWPIIAWVAIFVIVILLKFLDEIRVYFDSITFVVIVALAVGAWAGIAIAGRPMDVLIAGAVVGAVAGLLAVLDAYIHGDPSGREVLAIFLAYVGLNVIGAILGSGLTAPRRIGV